MMWDLNRGQGELLSITSKYHIQPPIMLILLVHHEHRAPFLRAVLSILNENPLDDDYGDDV